MAEIEKDLVKKSFGNQAKQYDTLAHVQKRVSDRLIDLLQSAPDTPARILDIGSGTGRLLEKIRALHPSAQLAGIDLALGMTMVARNRLGDNPLTGFICGDAERLPFHGNSFDMVVSTSTYQWIASLNLAFAEVYRILKPGSRFIFALFGEKTLFELKESYRRAVIETGKTSADRTHRFASADEVAAAMESAGFVRLSLLDENETEWHRDVPSLIRSLKGIGAGNASRRNSNGLAGRGEMLRMMDIYRENFGTDSGVKATYHVIYGIGLKQ